MKTVILCGGFGTRLSEETVVRPKPMVEIGGIPMLLHIMKIYAAQGHKEFILAMGYKSEFIKDYFLNFRLQNHRKISLNLQSGETVYERGVEKYDWNIDLVDTGLNAMTGGRLFNLRDVLKNEKTFMVTYGDGVADIDINALLKFHKQHGKKATVTAVRPPARFGCLRFEGDQVAEFQEKPQAGEGWINGGFFVFESSVLNYLHSESAILEKDALENLAKDGELVGYRHDGFWQCMDTLRDKNYLETIWQEKKAPWNFAN
jgi:glucose-1-phosphate cytidylyltransferase